MALSSQDKYALYLNSFCLTLCGGAIYAGASPQFLLPIWLVVCAIPTALASSLRHATQQLKATSRSNTPPPKKAPQPTPSFIKPTLWQGNSLKGRWIVTRKADGIRAIKHQGQIVTTSGNPWPIRPELMPSNEAEIYFGPGNWKKVI